VTTPPPSADTFDHVTTATQLERLVDRLAQQPFLSFDTEFVSEHTYRSQLCLIQVAAPGVLAVIDTLAVMELDPFWRLFTDPTRTTVVHAGREEMGFILHAIGQRPANLFDVQLAAGLVDHDYPAGYAALVRRLLNLQTNKGETRTDWRRRPLSAAQLDYAPGADVAETAVEARIKRPHGVDGGGDGCLAGRRCGIFHPQALAAGIGPQWPLAA
jgi:ribonuclease D